MTEPEADMADNRIPKKKQSSVSEKKNRESPNANVATKSPERMTAFYMEKTVDIPVTTVIR